MNPPEQTNHIDRIENFEEYKSLTLSGVESFNAADYEGALEKFLSMSTPLAVTGPFDDFQVGIVPGGFVTTLFRWYYGLIYVPWKWITGERFPPDGIATCYNAMGWELPAQ